MYTKSEDFQNVAEDLLSLSLTNQNQVMPSSYRTLLDLGYSEEPVCIPDMGIFTTYRVKYFDPMSNYLLNQETVISMDCLPLENNPMLTDQRPFVFFKLYELPEGEFFETELPDHDTKINSTLPVNSAEDSSNLHQLRIYPVPCKTDIVIEAVGKSIDEYEIFDATGRKVGGGASNSHVATVDVSSLANGFYLIKINDHDPITFQKAD
jgi:hypothetical protein